MIIIQIRIPQVNQLNPFSYIFYITQSGQSASGVNQPS